MINKNLNDHSYAKRDYHHHHHVVDQQCQIRGRLYRWNEVLFSSTFNEIVRLDSAIVDDITQYSVSLFCLMIVDFINPNLFVCLFDVNSCFVKRILLNHSIKDSFH